ncbi:MAG: thioredoxin family protein [Desulfomonile sp.]|nr:thioredoxin family protein [Desulfomonile sp.]
MGLRSALEAIALSHADKCDEEVESELLERLRKTNYIPRSASAEYGRAFVREFRKFLGQSHEAEPSGPLRVVILGPGCSQCDRLEQMVMQVLSELNLAASVEHVTDLMEIAKFGLVRTPALAVNGKVVASGMVPTAKRIAECLTAAKGT